jgi:NAD(P)-dependent dehydrogenase (short-subunit alcohol dehydrogenase family)
MSTILITGANCGLGLEFVHQYAADGWEVLATSRQPEKSTNLKQLAAQYPTIVLYPLDVTEDESVRDLADKLDGKPIDVLLHSSGVYPREGQHIGDIDYDGWREAMETNLFGVMRVTEALLKNVTASQCKQIAAISTALSSLRGVQDGSVAQAGTSYQYRSS